MSRRIVFNSFKYHIDYPTVIWSNGDLIWLDENDEYHRENNLPAVVNEDGFAAWYVHGVRNRENGPAVITEDGHEIWFSNDIMHRSDGPAITYTDGRDPIWMVNGNDISNGVKNWLDENNITVPFTDEELLLFQMRWL